MAILGKFDAKAMGTDVGVTNGDATVTTAGDFTDASDNKIDAGDIIELSGVAYLVKEVTSATALELHTTYAGSTATVAAANAVRRTAPKAVADFVVKGGDTVSRQLIFADSTESGIAANKTRGIWGPGWWLYHSYTDAAGSTRHKAECLAPLTVTAAVAGDDSDDTIAADVAVVLAVTAQPSAVTNAADPYTGNPAFTVSATATGDATGATISVQWQRQTANATTRWVDVTGSLDGGVYSTGLATSSGARVGNLVITGAAKSALDGYKYRAKLTTSTGAAEIISDAATLTFA